MAFYDRLKEGRVNAGLTQEQLAEKLGVAKSTLSGYESGNREPTIATIAKALEILDIDANFLYQDEMENLTELIVSIEEKTLLKKYRFVSEHSPQGAETVEYILNREYLIAEQLQVKEETYAYTPDNVRSIDYYRKLASAGSGQVVFEDSVVERITIPDKPEYNRVAYAIGVNGRSMEPLYYDGDILLVEPTVDIQIGEIGIFIVDGEAYVKKLGNGKLISLNTDYDNVPLTEYSSCMGRVVDKISNQE